MAEPVSPIPTFAGRYRCRPSNNCPAPDRRRGFSCRTGLFDAQFQNDRRITTKRCSRFRSNMRPGISSRRLSYWHKLSRDFRLMSGVLFQTSCLRSSPGSLLSFSPAARPMSRRRTRRLSSRRRVPVRLISGKTTWDIESIGRFLLLAQRQSRPGAPSASNVESRPRRHRILLRAALPPIGAIVMALLLTRCEQRARRRAMIKLRHLDDPSRGIRNIQLPYSPVVGRET
jgi:hypothetical protein